MQIKYLDRDIVHLYIGDDKPEGFDDDIVDGHELPHESDIEPPCLLPLGVDMLMEELSMLLDNGLEFCLDNGHLFDEMSMMDILESVPVVPSKHSYIMHGKW